MWKLLVDLVYPRRCDSCGRSASDVVCDSCLEGVQWHQGPACARCGACLAVVATSPGRCPECRGKRIDFDSAVSLGAYQGRLRDLVIAFKHPNHRLVGDLFANQLAAKLDGRAYDLIVAVPMHRWDFVWRAHNPAAELAAALSKRTRTPFAPGALQKRRRTRPQKILPLAERLGNPLGAFHAPAGSVGRVLLVDDVLTTGATLSECARILKAAGAARVDAAVVARDQAALTVELLAGEG